MKDPNEKMEISYVAFKKESHHNGILYKEVVKDFIFEPDDYIEAGYRYEDENCGSSGFYFVVHRTRMETDDEFNTRIQRENNMRENLKKQRYETYLKLKNEFEK